MISRRYLLLPLLAVGILSGCAVVPNDGYHVTPSYNASVYVAPAPVYVAPYWGLQYRSAPRYYPRYEQRHRPRHPERPRYHRHPDWRR